MHALTMWFLSACALCLLTQLPVASGCGRGAVYMMDNEYRQLLIAIAENVPEDLALLDRIKDVFKEASHGLFSATRNRAYFGEITVLVPKSWSSNPMYQPVTNETFDTSDVVVDLPDPTTGNKPFTINTTPCGELGSHIVLTPEFIMDDSVAQQYGPYSKVLVHEWAHLRYGVYDEYASENGGEHFYAASSGNVEATRCSSALTGSMHNPQTGGSCAMVNGMPEEDCRFKDDDLPGTKYGSLMYKQYLDHINHFCDNDPSNPDTHHNREAPTEQNRLCGGKSIWEILNDHHDFTGGINGPLDPNEYEEPTFKFVRAKERRTVLVLDVSGSMKDDSKITRQNQGCSNYIASIANDEEKIGIVQFSNVASTKIGMTVVSSSSRNTLISKLPTVASGATSIGAGILKGLEVLNADGGTSAAEMIIVSDGEENTPPMLKDVWDQVMAAGITVHTIAFTAAAESTMDALAQATGGLAFLYSDSGSSNALNDAFEAIGAYNQNPSDQSYTIISEASTMSANQNLQGTAIVDATLGRDTEFLFDFGSNVDVTLTSPGGQSYTASSAECDKDATFKTFRCSFPGVTEVGTWEYEVQSTVSANQKLSVTVKSKSASPSDYPIIAQAFWGLHDMDLIVPGLPIQRLYASVSKGYVAVLGADVKAEVETPSGQIVTLTLLDNGAGPDLTKDDGIYSAYFAQFTGNGRYNVKVIVNSNPATMVNPQHIVGVGAAFRGTRYTRAAATPSGDFQRAATGGAFSLKGFTPGEGKIYPPGQILNVHVDAISETTITLTWTATGQELDRGNASYYEVRLSHTYDGLFEDAPTFLTQDAITNGASLTAPKPPHESEVFEFTLPDGEKGSYFFAVTAHDAEGRNATSPISNVVSAYMGHPPPEEGDSSTVVFMGGIMGYFKIFTG